MSNGKYTLTYWPIRGLGAVPSMQLILSGLPHDVAMSGAPWPNGSYEAAAEKLPLINLPCLTLPTGEVISQSGAIVRFLASKCPNLKPADDVAAARCDEAMEHLTDFQKEWTTMAYGAEFEKLKASFLAESVPYYFGALDKQMELLGFSFITGANMTVADLMLYEHVQRLITLTGSTDSIKHMNKVLAVHAAIKAHPELQEFHANTATMAFNGPPANWSPLRF